MHIPKIEISVKFNEKVPRSELFQIVSSRDSYEAVKEIFNADTVDWIEEFLIICLNKGNKVTGFFKISQGGTDATIVDQKVVFTVALNCCATSIILAHNHPSGTLRPSQPDIEITGKLKTSGDILGITVLDHIIISDEGYFSFADEGMI